MKPFDESSPLNCRVIAASTREALRLVREKLGPDAIVLSNRVSTQGVEMMATLDEQQTLPMPVPVPVAAAAEASLSTSAPTPTPTLQPSPVPAPAPAIVPEHRVFAALAPPLSPAATEDQTVLREIHSMRGMIEEQLAGLAWNEQQRRDPVRGRLLRSLLGAGFSVQLARQLLKDLPLGQSYTGGMDYARAELMRQMPVLDSEDALMREGGVYALTGPTGVGKTTTTAKLAARCVLRFGADKLALVTTDSYRIGAYEQLRIYGQILGVPVYAVKDPADLKRVLADLRDKHMVLIDTVGMSQRDRAVSDQIAMLCSAGRPVKRLLLLNAASHGDTLNEVVHAYRQGADKTLTSDLAGCIFTKVDEATHPGVLIDMAIRHQLPVHYISSGQKVPEHLMLADCAALVESVFQARSQSALFVPVAANALDESLGEAAQSQAQAQAQAVLNQRLRAQCQHLIRALTSNAKELSANAAALSGAGIGFDESRQLWRKLGDQAFDAAAVGHCLSEQAARLVSQNCRSYALALSEPMGSAIQSVQSVQSAQPAETDQADQAGQANGSVESAHRLWATLLLSDQTGQLLSVAGYPPCQAGLNPRLDALGKPLSKPFVHLFARLPAPALMASLQTQSLAWLASCPASLAVMDGGTGKPVSLGTLAKRLCFVAPEPVVYRGKKAWLAVAETVVWLRPTESGRHNRVDNHALDSGLGSGLDRAAPVAATPVVLRCIVRRISDAQSGKPITHSYLLANHGLNAVASEVAEWPVWRAAAEPYFKLLRQTLALRLDEQWAAAVPEAGAGARSDDAKTLLIAAQSASTVYRLQTETAPWAEPVRQSLARLAGRSTRLDRPVPSAGLLDGLEKLFVLLDAFETDSAPSGANPSALVATKMSKLL